MIRILSLGRQEIALAWIECQPEGSWHACVKQSGQHEHQIIAEAHSINKVCFELVGWVAQQQHQGYLATWAD